MTTPSLLTSLLTLITSATQDLQTELAAEGLPEPWIDNPALHPWEEGTPSWKYWEARRTLLSALGMMTVRLFPSHAQTMDVDPVIGRRAEPGREALYRLSQREPLRNAS